MDDTSYTFDPNGDVYLNLRNPCKTPLVVFDDPKPAVRMRSVPTTRAWEIGWNPFRTSFKSVDPSGVGPDPVEEPPAEEPPPHRGARRRFKQRTVRQPAADFDEAAPPAKQATDEELGDASTHGGAADGSPFEQNGSFDDLLFPEQPVIKMRVSSRHLILASDYFRTALTKFQEGTSHAVDTEDWDEDALVILMNIIHGHNGSVPRSVDLEMLAKIAVLVDYYKCREAAELFSEIWIEKLRPSIPQEYGRDLILWICVSWVFSKGDIFTATTKTALRESCGPIDAPELPIPGTITDEIDRVRRQSIHAIIDLLDDLLIFFRDKRTACTYACSAMLFGVLTKRMHENEILSLEPTSPLYGYSVMAAIAAARDIQCPDWSPVENRSYHSYTYPHKCRIDNFVKPNIDGLESTLEGLKLKDFKSSKIYTDCKRQSSRHETGESDSTF